MPHFASLKPISCLCSTTTATATYWNNIIRRPSPALAQIDLSVLTCLLTLIDRSINQSISMTWTGPLYVCSV